MKKIFAIVFAVSALSLLLAGCKKDEAATDTTGGTATTGTTGETK